MHRSRRESLQGSTTRLPSNTSLARAPAVGWLSRRTSAWRQRHVPLEAPEHGSPARGAAPAAPFCTLLEVGSDAGRATTWHMRAQDARSRVLKPRSSHRCNSCREAGDASISVFRNTMNGPAPPASLVTERSEVIALRVFQGSNNRGCPTRYTAFMLHQYVPAIYRLKPGRMGRGGRHQQIRIREGTY